MKFLKSVFLFKIIQKGQLIQARYRASLVNGKELDFFEDLVINFSGNHLIYGVWKTLEVTRYSTVTLC